MNFVEDRQGQDPANARHRSQAVERIGGVAFGLSDDREFEVGDQGVVLGHQGQIDDDAVAHAGIGEVFPRNGGVLIKLRLGGRPCEDQIMHSSPLRELLKLPAGDRAELAMALWESLSDAEREGALRLTDEQRAELDRRWAEHLANPDSGIPWSEVRSKLIG